MSDQYRKDISDYYSKEIQHTSDLKYSCCVSIGNKHKWHGEILSKISPEVLDKYYGCGSPIPDGLSGTTILDLGCGTGKDCFLASVISGKNGKVIGVDMTDEQLEVASRSISYHKRTFPESSPVEFKKGYIEDLKSIGIEDESIDVVISNCVVNLSNDKQKVFNEIHRVLKNGGEVHISDIFTNFKLGQAARDNKVLVGECMGNALDINTFIDLMKNAGFNRIFPVETRYIPVDGIPPEIIDPSIKFYSVTFSAFKVNNIIDDWKGNWVKYIGNIDHCENELDFDLYHKFKVNEKVFVGTDLFDTLQLSRYKKYLEFGKEDDEKCIPQKPVEKSFVQTVLGNEYNDDSKKCCSCCCCCNKMNENNH